MNLLPASRYFRRTTQPQWLRLGIISCLLVMTFSFSYSFWVRQSNGEAAVLGVDSSASGEDINPDVTTAEYSQRLAGHLEKLAWNKQQLLNQRELLAAVSSDTSILAGLDEQVLLYEQQTSYYQGLQNKLSAAELSGAEKLQLLALFNK